MAEKLNRDIMSVAWQYDGAQIVCLDKNQNIVILDPRQNPDLEVRVL